MKKFSKYIDKNKEKEMKTKSKPQIYINKEFNDKC